MLKSRYLMLNSVSERQRKREERWAVQYVLNRYSTGYFNQKSISIRGWINSGLVFFFLTKKLKSPANPLSNYLPVTPHLPNVILFFPDETKLVSVSEDSGRKRYILGWIFNHYLIGLFY